jgi:hypothetical protein
MPMMMGGVDVGVIALGILVPIFAPFVLMIAIMSADAPGSSRAPGCIMIGGGLALVALIAWWVDHPFQFLGGIALTVGGFVAYVAVFNLKEHLQRRGDRKEIAKSEPPREPVPCALVWDGVQVAEFEAGEGLPAETDHNFSYRGQSTHGSPEAGTLTFRRGSTRNVEFVRWCESGGTRLAAQPKATGAALSIPGDIDVQIFNQGKKIAEITLKDARCSQFEIRAGAGPSRDAVGIKVLTIEYEAWKHAWESLGRPTKKA